MINHLVFHLNSLNISSNNRTRNTERNLQFKGTLLHTINRNNSTNTKLPQCHQYQRPLNPPLIF